MKEFDEKNPYMKFGKNSGDNDYLRLSTSTHTLAAAIFAATTTCLHC